MSETGLSPGVTFHQHNPAQRVEQAFCRIAREHMADVPLVNPALSVQAIDFQRWQGHWLGMVVTPWCMSVLLVPGRADPWISLRPNQRRFVTFAAGEFAFLGGFEVELGEYQSCALFSPMSQFATSRAATMTARASMSALLTPSPAQGAPRQAPAASDRRLSRRRLLALR